MRVRPDGRLGPTDRARLRELLVDEATIVTRLGLAKQTVAAWKSRYERFAEL